MVKVIRAVLRGQGDGNVTLLPDTMRHYPVRKTRLGFKTIITPSKKAMQSHCLQRRAGIIHQKTAPQAHRIKELGPVISGGSNYYSRVWSKRTYGTIDHPLFQHLRAWSTVRHPKQSQRWVTAKYGKGDGGTLHFSPTMSRSRLHLHSDTPIKRHVQIQGNRSPYDGAWRYWRTSMGPYPGVPTRVAKLLKRQQGRCPRGGRYYKPGDLREVDHILPKTQGGKDAYHNWQLLPRHCHDNKTAEDRRRYGYQAPDY